jgi:archaemetzincin
MDIQNITLIPFGYFEEVFLKSISEAVKHEFHFPVNIKEGHLDLSEFYDPIRRQYNGTKLLREIDSLFSSDTGKTIGLFSVDLYIPILTYIYGQAFLNGRSGIASVYRLSNERYGMNIDDKIIQDRFIKEVIHELGHAFGLIHCYIPTCVMRSSTYVEDIDQKSANFCFSCKNQIDAGLSDL